VLFRNNLVNTAFGELYHASGAGNGYDQLNQLTAFSRRTLSASGGTGTPLDSIASPSHVYATETAGLTPTQYPGATGNFVAYATNWFGGAFVAAGHIIPANTVLDIVTGPDSGGGPDVRVFAQPPQSMTPSPTLEFNAYVSAWHGGVRVAAGDTNGDGVGEIITAPGPGAGSSADVRVFQNQNGSMAQIQELLAYGTQQNPFSFGVYVASGDVNNDGHADIITGPGSGTGVTPDLRVFSGANVTQMLEEFLAYASGFAGGVRVGYLSDLNSDSEGEVVTIPGPTGGADTKIFDNGVGGNLGYESAGWISSVAFGFFVAGSK
jgi:hypothetical protein